MKHEPLIDVVLHRGTLVCCTRADSECTLATQCRGWTAAHTCIGCYKVDHQRGPGEAKGSDGVGGVATENVDPVAFGRVVRLYA